VSVIDINTTSIISQLTELGVNFKDAVTLAAVGYAESGYNPSIAGDSGQSIGLFQIYMPAHADKLTKWTGSNDKNDWITWLSNPDNNIYAASQVYKSQGLGAWTMYKNGGYKPYVDKNLTVKQTTATAAQPQKPLVEGGTITQGSTPFYKEWYEGAREFFYGPNVVDPKEELQAREWAENRMEEKGITPTKEWMEMTEAKQNAWDNSPKGQQEQFFTDTIPNTLWTGGIYLILAIVGVVAIMGIFVTRK